PTHGSDIDPDRELSSRTLHLSSWFLQVDGEGKWDHFFFRKGIQILQSFSLIKENVTGRVYFMHALVHSWMQDRMSLSQKLTLGESAGALLCQSISFEYTTQDFVFRRLLVPHIEAYMQQTVDVE